MADIFLSYARENVEQAGRLAAVLESLGWSVWWDRQIPVGRSFSEVIEEALRQARCVIVLWSADANRSSWVREEAEEAKNQGKLVPVRLEDVLPPLGFRALQAADLMDWDGTPESPTLRRLAEDLSRLLPPPASPSPPTPVPPVPWPAMAIKGAAAVVAAAVALGGAYFYHLAERETARQAVAQQQEEEARRQGEAARVERERQAAEAQTLRDQQNAARRAREAQEAQALEERTLTPEPPRAARESSSGNTLPDFSGSLGQSLYHYLRANQLGQREVNVGKSLAPCGRWSDEVRLEGDEGRAFRFACIGLADFANGHGWNLASPLDPQQWAAYCRARQAESGSSGSREVFMRICLKYR